MTNSAASWRMRARRWASPGPLFLIIGALFGLAWALITPPFQAPDENFHFCRAYQLSEGRLFGISLEGVRGDSLPVSVIETMEKINPGMRFHSLDQRQDLEKVYYYLRLPLQAQVRAFYPFPTAVVYPPTAYLPQILGIWVGRALGQSALVCMYLGRFLNLACWLALIYSAIRITPVGRWLLMLLALMPMHLFLAASLSQDAAINGIIYFLLAFILRAARSPEPHSRITLALIFLITMLISFSKPGFAVLALLCLLLPRPAAGARRRYYLLFALLLAASLVMNSLWYTLSDPDLNWNQPYANYDQQRALLQQNPFIFIAALLRSLWTFKFFYLRSHIGQLGWLDTVLPLDVIAIFLLLICGAAQCSSGGLLSLWQKTVMAGVAMILFAGIFAGLYLVCSPVGAPYVQGMSGRYLIPIAPLFWLLFNNRAVVCTRLLQWPWKWPAMALLLFALGRTTLVLYRRYYIL